MALLQFRRGTAAQWTAANPVLASGEPGRETDTKRRKVGDGVTAWTSLPYEFDSVLASAAFQTISSTVLAWAYAQSFRVVSATRDSNEAITTASVVWPDGATGTFTTDTASTAFPGAIDAYHVTHILGGVTTTYTQPAVTRDAGGAVTAQPAITVA